MKYLRILAVSILVALVVMTVVPASDRPVTGIPHDLEHGLAFVAAGFCFAVAFDMSLSWLLCAAAGFALALECLQIPLPTRHARLEDFVVDALSIMLGIVLARAGKTLLPRFQT